MRRDQLEHAIRTACQIIGHDAVVVVGSQSILGFTYPACFRGGHVLGQHRVADLDGVPDELELNFVRG